IYARQALSDGIFVTAIQLASRWTARLGTRSLDLIHVASAVVFRADVFHTFDDRQRKLALAAGLTVV
ncbi:MAG TPA: hypothetical protein VJ728_00760, partial [Candidatus Binataceae bacterium]|nr:hypothetical protein [Candidatus Binataceae bacterium]